MIALLLVSVSALARPTQAQAPLAGGLPGAWIEANTFRQGVSNDFGDWSGVYLRGVKPGARDTYYAEVLALEAFGERGVQGGLTHRHDWSTRFFHTLGATVGSGASILPQGRVDGALGVRFGDRKQWQATAGASYVKSVTELYDVAGTSSLAWYAPRALLLETGVRYNISRPGSIRSHRLFGVAVLTPSPRRSFSVRAIGGTEGWQIVSSTTTLQRFASQEYSLSWREKVSGPWALTMQGDVYRNPFYVRSGVTIGVARYW
ncbi:YaiO family outer membrane beta-barrel protein [Gemmatimonas sp.]|uniref:YaiO family outer membrane beta-barrel protein n=1 Tax=Gemmatimonas sp. TaxID=1962908 RepID=UPI0035649411